MVMQIKVNNDLFLKTNDLKMEDYVINDFRKATDLHATFTILGTQLISDFHVIYAFCSYLNPGRAIQYFGLHQNSQEIKKKKSWLWKNIEEEE